MPVDRFRADSADYGPALVEDLARNMRRLKARATNGRIGGPILLETVANGDGTYRVLLRNEDTGNTTVITEAL